ncbi:MAG TPA: fibronectin type III domain-containing protein [Lentimicrobium sp.]|nr:fibronectin type III domain-containing protein [Lentimicrobium sp.]
MRQTLLLIALFIASNTIVAQNLYLIANAASIDNEENSYDGWSGPAQIESKNDNPKTGQYTIKIKSKDEGRYAQYSFNADPGTNYLISIWARKGNHSSNPVFDDWEGFSGFEKKNITGQGWKEYVFIVTATSGHPTIKVLASKNPSEDKEVYIDAVSILIHNTVDNEPPSSPADLSASNVTSNSLTLTWSSSNDNTGVTGYKIYCNHNYTGESGGLSYNIMGLTSSTSYNFYVKAVDAAGNVSQASNNIDVITLNSGGEGNDYAYTPENSNLPTVDWQARNFYAAGRMGVGTFPSNNFRLAVNGKIRAKEIVVESGWADFVFEPGYLLPSLKDVKKHIRTFGHLQGIPNVKEIKENGVSLGEVNSLLLQKIEEITLYIIQADERIEALEKEIRTLK